MSNWKSLTSIPSFKESLQVLVEAIQCMSDHATDLADTLYAALLQIEDLEDDITELKKNLQECKVHLSSIHSRAHIFILKVEQYLRCGEVSDTEQHEIKQAIRRGQLESLNSYLDEFAKLFDQSESAHKYFDEVCKKCKPICKEGMEFCDLKRDEAKGRKWHKQVIGGTFAGATAAVGAGGVVGASVVAGLFTFGIGTPIVLGISALVSGGAFLGGATTATVAGVYTHKIATKYSNMAEIFHKISIGFESVSNAASSIGSAMFKLKEVLVGLKYNANNVQDAFYHEDYDLCKLFDMLLKSVNEARSKVHETSEKMRKEVHKIE